MDDSIDPRAPNSICSAAARFAPRWLRPGWILLTITGLALAALAVRFAVPLYLRHAARRTLEANGAQVSVDSGGPDWLRERIGDEALEVFDVVTGVDFMPMCDETTDAMLQNLRPLSEIQTLDLDGTPIGDAGLAHLAGLTKLAELKLTDTQITGAGLVHLAGMKRLRWLSLESTTVEGDGLKHLQGLTSLEKLSLHKARG